MIERPWAKKRIVKADIIVDVGRTEYQSLEIMINELNELFDEHRDFGKCHAYLDKTEKLFCKLCNHEYEEMYEDDDWDKKHPKCQWCGGGETEYMLKRLEESK